MGWLLNELGKYRYFLAWRESNEKTDEIKFSFPARVCIWVWAIACVFQLLVFAKYTLQPALCKTEILATLL